MRVLVLEDDPDLRLAVVTSLRGRRLAVDAVADLRTADEARTVNHYDCAVLDRRLPDGDALDSVRAWQRQGWRVPVLFLTALDRPGDIVGGLAHGDYLAKPFAMDELVARVLRLVGWTVSRPPPPLLTCADLELDTARREARRAGVLLGLTGKEFAVLELLLLDKGATVTRETLHRHVWDEHLPPAPGVLEQVLRTLRGKLRNPPLITTERGVGYRIGDPAP